MKFTDRMIANLKCKEKQYYQREGDGFAIRVMPSGTKTFLYIYTVAGKRRQMNMGEYPVVTLAAARERLADVRKDFKDGKDPQEVGYPWHRNPERERREAAAAAAAESRNPTMRKLAEEYMEKHAKPNKKTWRRDEHCLNKDVLPVMGHMKAQDVRKRNVVLLLEGIVERGAPGQARNVLEVLRRMFTFAVERDILETSPMFGVKPLTKKVAKDRVLTADEIRTLWEGLDRAAISDEIARALKLILVTGARPGEVIGMHSEEIDGDWWQIPAARSKNGIVHRVFLTGTAKELIGCKEGFIFESPRSELLPDGARVVKPMDVNALAYALRRNLKGYKRQRAARKESASDVPAMVPVPEEKKIEMAPFTPHDLRRTAATLIAELGFSNEIIDAALGHKARGVVAVYNRHDYSREKQQALQALERKLTTVVTGEAAGKVIPMRRAKTS